MELNKTNREQSTTTMKCSEIKQSKEAIDKRQQQQKVSSVNNDGKKPFLFNKKRKKKQKKDTRIFDKLV